MLTTFIQGRVAEIRRAEQDRRIRDQTKTIAELRQLLTDRNALLENEKTIRDNDLLIEGLVKEVVGKGL